jgi:hypothetical protein
MWKDARWVRSASLAVLFAFCIALVGVGQGQAREYEIDGTADCGLRNEQRCTIGSVLSIWTDDITGSRQRFEVDVSWIKDALEEDKIDQDDHICLIIEDRQAVRLKAIGMSQSCRFDGTINAGLSTGSKEVSEQPDHNEYDDDDKQAAVGPTPTLGPPGTLTGIVTNALTADPLSGAVVRVDGTGESATTGSNGRFTITNVASGARIIRTSASGFVTETRTVTIVAGTTVEQAIALTPGRAGGEITIVLTWGGQPRDLDAHLSGPNRSGGRFHLYYANPSAPSPSPYATLDVDDILSFGPETITISRDATTGTFVAGEYRYWVHNFSTSPEFDVSDARVTVNSGGAQLDSFTVPSGPASLDIWRVVNLNIDAAGNVTLTSIQSFATGFDTTPFSVPSGSDPGPSNK